MNPLSDCLGHPDYSLSGEDKVSATISPVMPTVKHPETIHVWGCFSAKGAGSLTILPKNTAMNIELVPTHSQRATIQEQFGNEQCLFQHDGAPCHKAKMMTK
jgi:hypothetical protein